MNLTLHHFKKEARRLLPRWLPWLAVLALQLAADAEWLAPMRADGVEPFWYALLPLLQWCGAVWLALSYPREDAVADDHSFIAVRPLPAHSYWLARGLVLALMVALPLAVQEGLYLAASGRPVQDVLIGMGERAFMSGAMLACLLPVPALAGGWGRYGVVGAVLFCFMVLQTLVSEAVQRWCQVYLSIILTGGRFALAAWLGAALMAALAVWQRRRRSSFARVLACVAALTSLVLAFACTPLLKTPSQRGEDPSWIAEVERQHGASLKESSLDVSTYEDRQGSSRAEIRLNVQVPGLPPGLLPFWRKQRATLTQGDHQWADSEHVYGEEKFFFDAESLTSNPGVAQALQPAIGPNALAFTRMGWPQREDVVQGAFPLPADLDTPVDLRSEQEVDWLRLDHLGSCPFETGAGISSRFADVRILDFKPNQDAGGRPAPGALMITVKLCNRTLETQGSPYPFWSAPMLMLYAPRNRLLWQNGSGDGLPASRAVHSGWMRGIYRLYWKDVIAPGTGITAAHLADLRLTMVYPHYLGTSHHSITTKGLKLNERIIPHQWPWSRSPLIADHPWQAMREAVARMPRPGPEAPRAEAAHYVGRVFSLAHALDWRYDSKPDATPRWPGDDRAVAAQMAPVILRHPDLITRLPYGAVMGSARFISSVLGAALLLSGLPDVSADAETGQPVCQGPAGSTARLHLLASLGSGPEGWQALAPAIEQALHEKSSQPLRVIEEQRLAREKAVPTDEEILASLRTRQDMHSFAALKTRPALRPAARAMFSERYHALIQPAATLRPEGSFTVLMGVAAGLPDALDQTLRQVALKNDKEPQGRDVFLLSQLSQLLDGPPLKWADTAGFIRTVRTWKAQDFTYDPEAMSWKRQAGH